MSPVHRAVDSAALSKDNSFSLKTFFAQSGTYDRITLGLFSVVDVWDAIPIPVLQASGASRSLLR